MAFDNLLMDVAFGQRHDSPGFLRILPLFPHDLRF